MAKSTSSARTKKRTTKRASNARTTTAKRSSGRRSASRSSAKTGAKKKAAKRTSSGARKQSGGTRSSRSKAARAPGNGSARSSRNGNTRSKNGGSSSAKRQRQTAGTAKTVPGMDDLGADARQSIEGSPVRFEIMHDLLYQALQTEESGVEVYKTAIRLAQHDELEEEWKKYLEQTKHHVKILTELIDEMGLDPGLETPGRKVVKHIGDSLVKAMEMARRDATPEQAELVAAECVVHAETKDNMNWELVNEISRKVGGKLGKRLKTAYDEVSEEEGEHLYHTMGYARELHLAALGLPAVLPPPEEKRDVQDAMQAARAKRARKRMIKKGGPGILVQNR